ncbi:MAG: flagellar hook-associated protein FlgK [Balneolaceae bacterium]|nr:flagellar hook-associated protein FlgK [Balneolaceae bacterium]
MKTLFEISKSGLAGAQRSLSVTSNNIVNADTEGYTRQRVDRTPVGYNSAYGNVGLGVNISTANRLRNEMNDQLTNQNRQDLGSMTYKNQVFERLQAAMTTDSGGDLDVRISSFFDSFSDLANNPQDMSVRNSLLTEAQQLSSKLNNLDQHLVETGDLIAQSTATTISDVNTLLAEIYELNTSITRSTSMGTMDSASLDLRVQKLEELSGLVDFTQMTADSGATEIRIGGVRVLDEEKLLPIKSEYNPNEQQLFLRISGGTMIDVSGGELGAQIDMYENDIPDLKAKLDLIASTIVSEVNAIHQSGFGLNDATPRAFFDPTGVSAGSISVNPDLLANPENIAASTVSGEAGNGSLAAQINDLRENGIVNGRKLIDFTIEAISKPGAQIFTLSSQIETKEAEIAMLQTQQERQAGVNIDEELANMIQFQNSYQGAARVMQTATELYDTLLSIV